MSFARFRVDLPYPAAVRAVPTAEEALLARSALEGRALGDHALDSNEARLLETVGTFHAAWLKAGSCIYDFPPPLVAAFCDTEFPLTGKDLPLPLEAFYLRTMGANLVVRGPRGATPLDGFYVATVTERLHFIAIGMDRDLDGSLAFADFSIPLDQPIEATIAKVAAQYPDRHNVHDFVSWIRVVAGACAYLAQESPDVEPRVCGPTDRQRANRGTKTGRREFDSARLAVSYYRVGYRERLSAHYSETKEQRQLTRKHVVRGHFRKQACGEGWSQRRLIWIKPFWRGPESEVATRVVQVRD